MSSKGYDSNTMVVNEEAQTDTYSKFVSVNSGELLDLLEYAAKLSDHNGAKCSFKSLAHNSVDCWINGAEDSFQNSVSYGGAFPMDVSGFNVTRRNMEIDNTFFDYINQFTDNTNVNKIFYFSEPKEFWIVIKEKTYEEVMRIRQLHTMQSKNNYIGECIILSDDQIDYESAPIPSFELVRSE